MSLNRAVRRQENSSFANFGRVSACAICKCAVSIFLSFCSKITAVVDFSSLVPNVDGMVSCGSTRQFPIRLRRPFLRATKIRNPLKPACTICVRPA